MTDVFTTLYLQFEYRKIQIVSNFFKSNGFVHISRWFPNFFYDKRAVFQYFFENLKILSVYISETPWRTSCWFLSSLDTLLCLLIWSKSHIKKKYNSLSEKDATWVKSFFPSQFSQISEQKVGNSECLLTDKRWKNTLSKLRSLKNCNLAATFTAFCWAVKLAENERSSLDATNLKRPIDKELLQYMCKAVSVETGNNRIEASKHGTLLKGS